MKTLEDFNVDHQHTLRKDALEHLATSTYIDKAHNGVLLGPLAVGKTHLAIAHGHKANSTGYAVQFDTAVGWLASLQAAQAENRLADRARWYLRSGDSVPRF